MVHCIYERVIKLKRNFKKLYIVFCVIVVVYTSVFAATNL